MKKLLLCLVLAGCAHPHKILPIQDYANFTVRQDAAETFTVMVKNKKGEGEVKELLCTTQYVCSIQQLPLYVVVIERARK